MGRDRLAVLPGQCRDAPGNTSRASGVFFLNYGILAIPARNLVAESGIRVAWSREVPGVDRPGLMGTKRGPSTRVGKKGG